MFKKIVVISSLITGFIGIQPTSYLYNSMCYICAPINFVFGSFPKKMAEKVDPVTTLATVTACAPFALPTIIKTCFKPQNLFDNGIFNFFADHPIAGVSGSVTAALFHGWYNDAAYRNQKNPTRYVAICIASAAGGILAVAGACALDRR
jgi:hypothetical protein